MSCSPWKNWFLIALAVVLSYPLIRQFLPIALPFLLALGLALAAEPAVGFLSNRGKLPRSIAAGVGVSTVFLLSGVILTLAGSLLVRQLGRLATLLPAAAEAISQGTQLLQQWLLSLAEKAPGSIRQTLVGIIQALFQDESGFFLQAAEKLPQIASSALGSVSNGVIWIITAVLAAFMISARLPQLRSQMAARIPDQWRRSIFPSFRALRQSISRWVVAQCKLSAVTLALLCAGFLLLKQSNALLWAILVTLVDILPILGVGTVLLPWSLVCYLQGDGTKALGILALFGAVWLVRSILEPRLIGKELGLDPLLTLVCIYGGFRLAGIAGMLLAPIAAITVLQLSRMQQKPL